MRALGCAGDTTFRPPAARREYDLKTALLACAEDKTALENIYGQEAPWLLRAAYRIVCQLDIADDVIQDPFIQVWHEAQKLSTPTAGRRAGFTALLHDCNCVNRGGARHSGAPSLNMPRTL